MNDLPLQVAEINEVEIDEANAADAGGGEIEAERRTEPAGADEQNARGLQPFLPFEGDFRHDQMPAVTSVFLWREIDALGTSGNGVEGGRHDASEFESLAKARRRKELVSFAPSRLCERFSLAFKRADDEAAIVAAEAEAVGDRPANAHLAGTVRHIVEVAIWIGRLQINRRMHDAVLDRQHRRD